MKSTELGQKCHDFALSLPITSYPDFREIVQDAAGDCRRRILSSSAKYEVNSDLQSFETAQIGTMVLGLREELLDVVNYCAMIGHLCRGEPGHNAMLMKMYTEQVAADAMSSLALVQSRLNAMIRSGEFSPNPGETYVEQLSVDSGVDHSHG